MILPSIVPAITLGNALKKLRTDAHLSPEELATDAGVSRSTVYRIESGEIAEPDLPTLRGLTRALDISLSALFHLVETGTGTEPASQGYVAREPGVVYGEPLSAEQIEFLERLAWACLRGADAAERANAQGILEELAVSFRRAADPKAAAAARAEVRAARRDRDRNREAS